MNIEISKEEIGKILDWYHVAEFEGQADENDILATKINNLIDKSEEDKDYIEKDTEGMVKEKSWTEFKNDGLLWFVNTILHVFGWSLVVEYDNDNKTEIKRAFPARVKYRGFDPQLNDKGYINISRYLVKNSNELFKEANE